MEETIVGAGMAHMDVRERELSRTDLPVEGCVSNARNITMTWSSTHPSTLIRAHNRMYGRMDNLRCKQAKPQQPYETWLDGHTHDARAVIKLTGRIAWRSATRTSD